jgi:hypothetical protein
MERLSALLALIAGCGFSAHAPANPGGDDTPGIDAAVPGDAAASIDGAAACVAGFLDLCKQAAPSTALDITNAQSINTDSDPRCRKLTQPAGSDVCLIYATRVAISGGGVLTASGKRPLAIASSSTMTIDGTIDVGSHGTPQGPAADTGNCDFGSNPAMDLGGAGGAAGGSFTLAGGNGGTGDKNDNGAPAGTAPPGTHGATTPIGGVLRGGCAGQTGADESTSPGSGNGGSGGHSGGALYLFALQSLEIKGKVRATGEGGNAGGGMAGGGGGGTGGLVVIESPSITISGQLSTNGGGGGQGGGIDNLGRRVAGRSGLDGNLGTTAALGGAGALNNDPGFGTGGAGGALTDAVNGTTADYGGGGGGGAAGVIKLLGAQQQLGGSTISPAPTP